MTPDHIITTLAADIAEANKQSLHNQRPSVRGSTAHAIRYFSEYNLEQSEREARAAKLQAQRVLMGIGIAVAAVAIAAAIWRSLFPSSARRMRAFNCAS